MIVCVEGMMNKCEGCVHASMNTDTNGVIADISCMSCFCTSSILI